MIRIRSYLSGNAATRGDEWYDYVHMLNSLVLCRPGLKHLEVSCSMRPTSAIANNLKIVFLFRILTLSVPRYSFMQRYFSPIAQAAGPSLRSPTSTKVYKSKEEDMTWLQGDWVVRIRA